MIGYVAALTGRTIENQGLLKVQLGDQTDAKVLLGTYHSTDVPGEFVWTAGVLTQVRRFPRTTKYTNITIFTLVFIIFILSNGLLSFGQYRLFVKAVGCYWRTLTTLQWMLYPCCCL